MKPRFQIRTLLIIINLIVLALPLAGIAALRIVENLVHRQTEAKLSAEAAYIKALYIDALAEAMDAGVLAPPYARVIDEPPRQNQGKWRPYIPTIDLRTQPILPEAEDSHTAEVHAHRAHKAAGRKIQPILERAQVHTLSGVRVLDPNGVVVATNGNQLRHDMSYRPEVQAALKGEYAAVLRERILEHQDKRGKVKEKRGVRIYVAIPMLYHPRIDRIDRDAKSEKPADRLAGVVYLHRTSHSFFRDMWEDWYTIFVIALVLTTILFSLFLSYVVTQPLRRIASQSERIAAGEDQVSLEVSRLAPAEAARLATSLEAMVERLRSRMEYVQEFARNVSHEFKTPLASTQGAIELLKEGWESMSQDERERFLSIIESDAKRMDRLTRRLLELARIEMGEIEEGETDLVETLTHLIHHYGEMGNEVELVSEDGKPKARIAPAMAETLLVNLLENAATHGKGAPVTVAIEPGPTVTVTDRGPGISEANLPRVFDRFFTTTRESGGTGLGLSMAKAIAEANGAAINVTSGPEGTSFKVAFKSNQANDE